MFSAVYTVHDQKKSHYGVLIYALCHRFVVQVLTQAENAFPVVLDSVKKIKCFTLDQIYFLIHSSRYSFII